MEQQGQCAVCDASVSADDARQLTPRELAGMTLVINRKIGIDAKLKPVEKPTPDPLAESVEADQLELPSAPAPHPSPPPPPAPPGTPPEKPKKKWPFWK